VQHLKFCCLLRVKNKSRLHSWWTGNSVSNK
jgi:hypothetical protein